MPRTPTPSSKPPRHRRTRSAVEPAPPVLRIGPNNPDRFINRELSWLDFNHRVVEEAENPRHPLLERLRYISISASNLDEFFSVRVAGLIGQAKAGVVALSADGRTPAQQLAEIQVRAALLLNEQQRVWNQVRDRLRDAGIELSETASLSAADRVWLEAWFMDRLFPVLTPLAIDPAHPFPFIPNMGLVKVLALQRTEDGQAMQALIPLPALVERFVRLPAEPQPASAGTNAPAAIRFVLLEDIVTLFLGRLFPGYHVLGQGMFRLIRDTDVEFEEEAEDLVRSYETALKRRRRGASRSTSRSSADMPQALRDARHRRAGRGRTGHPGEEIQTQHGILGASPTCGSSSSTTGRTSSSPPTPRASPSASATSPATASPPSAPRTSSSTTRSRASMSWCSSCAKPPATRQRGRGEANPVSNKPR